MRVGVPLAAVEYILSAAPYQNPRCRVPGRFRSLGLSDLDRGNKKLLYVGKLPSVRQGSEKPDLVGGHPATGSQVGRSRRSEQ